MSRPIWWGSAFGDVPVAQHVREAAVRGERLHRVAVGHDEAGVGVHVGDGVEREQVTRPLERPPPRRRDPHCRSWSTGRGTRTPPAGRRCGAGSRGSAGTDIVQSSPGLTKVWSRMARHSCGPSTSVRWNASIFPPVVVLRAAALLARSPRAAAAPTRRRSRAAGPAVRPPRCAASAARVLVEQVLEVGRARTGQPGEEDRRRRSARRRSRGTSATYRSTSMRLRSATASDAVRCPRRPRREAASSFMLRRRSRLATKCSGRDPRRRCASRPRSTTSSTSVPRCGPPRVAVVSRTARARASRRSPASACPAGRSGR